MSDVAVGAYGLGKQYRIGQVETGYTRLRRAVRRKRTTELAWVLKDLTFDIEEGDCVAIVGRNGAGKSTLLKLLSRITEPTAGYADIRGRVGALLEVGTGFHPELTGRENVQLNGALLGMQRAEVKRKFDEIVEFSGVAKYIDTPVKWYSSGMYVRLAFAVAAHLEPEILIVDEVLAVGDAEFQRRCLGRMSDVAREGRTVLFVSHNIQAVRRLCPHALLLEQGRLVEQGDTDAIVRRYLASVESIPEAGVVRWEDPATRPGNDVCRIVEVRITGEDEEPATSLFSSQPIAVTIEFDLARLQSSFTVGLDVTAVDGTIVFRSHHTDVPERAAPTLVAGRNAVRCVIPPGLLNSGRYSINLRVSLYGTIWIAEDDAVLSFDVIGDHGESLALNGHPRPGLIAPILDWVAVEPSASADVSPPHTVARASG